MVSRKKISAAIFCCLFLLLSCKNLESQNSSKKNGAPHADDKGQFPGSGIIGDWIPTKGNCISSNGEYLYYDFKFKQSLEYEITTGISQNDPTCASLKLIRRETGTYRLLEDLNPKGIDLILRSIEMSVSTIEEALKYACVQEINRFYEIFNTACNDNNRYRGQVVKGSFLLSDSILWFGINSSSVDREIIDKDALALKRLPDPGGATHLFHGSCFISSKGLCLEYLLSNNFETKDFKAVCDNPDSQWIEGNPCPSNQRNSAYCKISHEGADANVYFYSPVTFESSKRSCDEKRGTMVNQ